MTNQTKPAAEAVETLGGGAKLGGQRDEELGNHASLPASPHTGGTGLDGGPYFITPMFQYELLVLQGKGTPNQTSSWPIRQIRLLTMGMATRHSQVPSCSGHVSFQLRYTLRNMFIFAGGGVASPRVMSPSNGRRSSISPIEYTGVLPTNQHHLAHFHKYVPFTHWFCVHERVLQ